jgi:hypothetical protein
VELSCLQLLPSAILPCSYENTISELGPIKLKRAIVVPNSRIAFLARIAFGEGDYKVFYNDMIAAIKWLSES